MTHGIIFCGWGHTLHLMPQAGPYRLRTYLGQHGYQIEVVEHLEEWSIAEILKVIDRHSDTLLFIGVSLVFFRALKPKTLASIKLRWPHIKLILGAQEIMLSNLAEAPIADKAFYGYAEEALLHYLDFLSGRRTDDLDWRNDAHTGVDYVISDQQCPYTNTADLSIVWQANDAISRTMALPFETSRGCIFRCLYCSFPLIGKKKTDYIRDVDNMADEFKRNYDTLGTTNYTFMDDTLNESVGKLERINTAIKRSGVAIQFSCYIRIDLVAAFPIMIDLLLDMGFVAGVLGIESMNETVRKRVGKGLTNTRILDVIDAFRSKADRIWFEAGLIVGLPGETIASVCETNAWMIQQEHRYFDHWSWNPLYITRSAKWLISAFDRDYEKYGYRFVNNEWSTDLMTFAEAKQTADRLSAESLEHLGMRSFMINHLLGYGVTLDDLRDQRWQALDFAKLYAQKRAMIAQYRCNRVL